MPNSVEMRKCRCCRKQLKLTESNFRKCKNKTQLRHVCFECQDKQDAAVEVGEKMCWQCNSQLPLDAFYVRKSGGPDAYCKACSSKMKVSWAKDNPDRAKVTAKKYKTVHAEKIATYSKTYKAEYYARPEIIEKEKIRAKGRIKPKLQAKAYRQRLKVRYKHDEKLRERIQGEKRRHYARHKPDYIARANNRRAKLLEIGGEISGQDINKMFKDQNGCCYYCKCRVGQSLNVKWHVDHFIPVSRGGTNEVDNLVVACATCNLSKSNKMPWKFMPERFSPPEPQAAD